LPSETEWEYAARGGGKGQGSHYDQQRKKPLLPLTSLREVEASAANELGLHGMMNGNWEWTLDHGGAKPATVPSDGSPYRNRSVLGSMSFVSRGLNILRKGNEKTRQVREGSEKALTLTFRLVREN
jgi:formylglycine-generating enzyme required for sulfatase activity